MQSSTQGVASFGEPSSVASADAVSTALEDFDPNHFLIPNKSFMLGSPPEIYIPSNCSNSTANSTEMHTLLSTTVNTNFIPSGSSALFPDSHITSDFVPQPPQNIFNLQIPTSFNFSDSNNFAHSSNLQSSKFCPNLSTINPEDDIMQQIQNDMTGDPTNFDSIPDVNLSTNLSLCSHSCPAWV